jgi:hypothetical protein
MHSREDQREKRKGPGTSDRVKQSDASVARTNQWQVDARAHPHMRTSAPFLLGSILPSTLSGQSDCVRIHCVILRRGSVVPQRPARAGHGHAEVVGSQRQDTGRPARAPLLPRLHRGREPALPLWRAERAKQVSMRARTRDFSSASLSLSLACHTRASSSLPSAPLRPSVCSTISAFASTSASASASAPVPLCRPPC